MPINVDMQTLINNAVMLAQSGKCADYIPALANADKSKVGICIAESGTESGHGDFEELFTIQSISKVASLICALVENGVSEVFKHVGYNGTEEPFNTFYKLELAYNAVPQNPMINAGAIVTTSLIHGDRFEKILNMIRLMSGDNAIALNEEVYNSERSTGNRNKGLAYILKASNVMAGDVEDVVDVYFKQCSINVNCKHLANMAKFIGTGCKGLPEDKITNKDLTKLVLSIMSSSGMYDYSGRYMVEVGLPSKSGVGGGIMAVGPNGIGMGAYGPSLDSSGNSIAGVAMIRQLSEMLDYNIFLNY